MRFIICISALLLAISSCNVQRSGKVFFESAFCGNQCKLYLENEDEKDSLIYEGNLRTNYVLGLAKSVSFSYSPRKAVSMYVVIDSVATRVRFDRLPRNAAIIVSGSTRSCVDDNESVVTETANSYIEVRVKKNYIKIKYY